MRHAILVALAACSYVDTVRNADGTVYECGAKEFCFDGDAEELSALTGSECSETSRWWPALTNALGVGCRYECPPPASGCNARSGCYCP